MGGSSRRLPQARRKKVFRNQDFHFPLIPFIRLRLHMPVFQHYQRHISVLPPSSASTASRQLSSSILWIPIFTGHASVHFPQRLEAELRGLNSFIPRKC